ncbi:Apoptosis regulator BAX [Frankliniella fusca]|uniref:Apoptosis regulator BAX n=1 Tax=Frankliniella fusca TaxID=407009 RepID=A0AAE1LPQ5_9NEOP|nr:Apoptosis regulator BAX [Frankliniella fusca]
MVKPMPSRRCPPFTSQMPNSDFVDVDIQQEDPLSTNDQQEAGHVSHSLFSQSPEHQTYSQFFHSYDGSWTHRFSTPAPAPRERMSSVPDDEEIRSYPHQRRGSAPVNIQYAYGASSSSSSQENSSPPAALEEIASKGKELFWFILSEEVKAQEAASPGSFSALTISPSSHRLEVLNERGRFGGRTLRQIAEAFSHSPQRLKVQEYANHINLQSLNYNSFSDLLYGLFQEGGVTQARVLVLFFFCADIALRALKEKLTQHFQQLVDWTSRYITERLSAWVLEHGGWAAVLQESVDHAYRMAVVSLGILSLAALSIFVWRR